MRAASAFPVTLALLESFTGSAVIRAMLGVFNVAYHPLVWFVDLSGFAVAIFYSGAFDLRPILNKTTAEFLQRLQQAQRTEAGQSEDLRFDLEDAVLATEDLAELSQKIPTVPIPPKGPVVAGQEGKEQEEAAPPGKPTLKRRPEPPPKPK